MPFARQTAIALALVLCGLALCISHAQESVQPDEAATVAAPPANPKHNKLRPLNKKERHAVITTALDPRIPRRAEHDCSHLVHAIYERAGFPYAYAPSDDLYDGVEGFQRISRPQAGDVIVWRGHAGIVIRPERHQFFSFLSGGPGIADYQSAYWRGRGDPRFYRYLKNDLCAGCKLARNRSPEF